MSTNYRISYKPIKNLKQMHKLNNAYNLRAKCGVFASSDLKYCDNLKSQLTNKSLEQQQNQFFTLLEKINKIVENTLTGTIRKGKFLYYKDNEHISSALLKKIRFESFKSKVICNMYNFKESVHLPYINANSEETSPKILQYRTPDFYIIHPRERINNIIKDNDINCNQAFAKMLTGTPLSKLLNIKNNIVKELVVFLNKSNKSYDFIYSKDELNKIKLLANKYDTIENTLVNNGINTKFIETLISNQENKNLKIGDKLLNGDILIKNIKVFDKQKNSAINAILTFANTDRGYRFKIYKYDKNFFTQAPEVIKQYKHYIMTNNINGINRLNLKIKGNIKDSEIGEVFVDKNNRQSMQNEMRESKILTDEKINNILGNEEYFYYVHNLKNFNFKKYYNVSLILIRCLKDFGLINNIHKAYLEAQAYGDIKHSPIALYLYSGCNPISEKIKDIEKDIYNHKEYDYTKNVWLEYKI